VKSDESALAFDRIAPWRTPLYVKKFAEALPQVNMLLDVGCGEAPYRRLFKSKVRNYITLDVQRYSNLNLVADGCNLPIRDEIFDAVLCIQVLEHVAEPRKILEEIFRVLRPRGILGISAPQSYIIHMEPHDYYRYTKYGLRYLLEKAGLEICEIEPQGGYFALIHMILLSNLWSKIRPRFLQFVLRGLSATLATILDKLDKRKIETANYFVVCQKPSFV